MQNCPSRAHFKGGGKKRLVSSANHLRKQLTGKFSSHALLWPLTFCCFPPFPSPTALLLFFKSTDDANHRSPHLLHCPRSGCPYLSSPLLELPVSSISSLRSTLPTAARANLAKHRSHPVPLLIKSLRSSPYLQGKVLLIGPGLPFSPISDSSLPHVLWALLSLQHSRAPAGLSKWKTCPSLCLSGFCWNSFTIQLSSLKHPHSTPAPLRAPQTEL